MMLPFEPEDLFGNANKRIRYARAKQKIPVPSVSSVDLP